LGANDQDIIGISENGVMDTEGCASPQVFHFEGVVWSLGSDGKPFVSRQLSPIADDTVSVAGGINEVGDIVGFSGLCAPPAAGFVIGSHAVLWKKDGSVIDLGNFGGTYFNAAVAINNQAQVVGCSDLVVDNSDLGPQDLGPRAFLWEEGSGMQDLGVLPGDNASCGQGINDSGEVVGLSCYSNPATTPPTLICRSFHWQRGVMTDISTLPAVFGLQGVAANDINSRGEIPIAAIDPKIDAKVNPLQQIAAVLIPVGRPPAAIPAHSTRPNADALVSALAGAQPSTSNAAPQSCGVLGASCGWGHQCCAGELCGGITRRCCDKWLHGSACTSSVECCSGMCIAVRGGHMCN
jgi:probable HAF family extracellular repeat protein